MGKATFTEWAGQGGAGCYRHRGRAMLLIADSDMGDAADAAITAAGGRPLRRIAWAEVEAGLAAVVAAPVVLAEAGGVAPERLEQALPALGRFLDAMETRGVVTFATDQIDLVARHLMDAPVELLCDATIPQRALALAQAALPRALMLNDSMPDRVEDDRHTYNPGSECDDQHIRRMAEGIAQISRITAGLLSHTAPAEGGPGTRDLADRRRSFASEPAAGGQIVTPQEVRRVIQLRQSRSRFFGQFIGEGLFEDPAWDMLLDLFAAELEGNRVSVSSLCIAAGVAPTTALRWIARMTDMGLFVRHPDPVDRRRAFMTLSPRASEAMRAYLVAARKA
ncbi:MarR family winged helix-turn-helix transcriptional regulator [uncultured Sphingomonas sp.]|uniref:MarR family winged helix-turn-helix transcriptional regulator n=1 Tax=uncultured Sphingomonas sp. TaxID=158754 RepID=UPI0025E6E4D1|nr:MarR family winged helix-turn-helix transcriptional regulator [uncultured Sphingomonas sp.]